MKIYLTRHSKTVWNQEKRLQGRCDSPLTPEGIENAIALKKYLDQSQLSFDYIYSSPIQRAYQTAALLFDENLIIQDDNLVEMNFGVFEGRKISDILKTDEVLYNCLWHHPEQFTRISQGESYDEVIKRAHSFLNQLRQLESDSHVMVVTHGMYFIVLLATMLGLDKKDYVLINQKVVEGCSLTLVEEINGHYQLIKYNQCDFLPHIMNASFAK
ncbi:histidine phosphatase family protein [Candidatus Stoquefichus massiliensis]|uniref:histidine phosphatase family protein n=1 Tax=Candidatus Stoquefichus massiliensis TaxID=1470350 RepID=UPI0004850909|nr:histidine phosphatase family protein [Candidatus Stoquefichus massiliensis]